MSFNINLPGASVLPPQAEGSGVLPPQVEAGLGSTIENLRGVVRSPPTRTVGSGVFPSPQEERSPPQSIINQMLKTVRYICSFSWIKDLAFCLIRPFWCCCPPRTARVSPERLSNPRLSDVFEGFDQAIEQLELCAMSQRSGFSVSEDTSENQIGSQQTRTALKDIEQEREEMRSHLPELKKFLIDTTDDIKDYPEEIKKLVLKFKEQSFRMENLRNDVVAQKAIYEGFSKEGVNDIRELAKEVTQTAEQRLEEGTIEYARLDTELDKELESNFYDQSIQVFFAKENRRPKIDKFYRELIEKRGSRVGLLLSEMKGISHCLQKCSLKVSPPPTSRNPFDSSLSLRLIMEIIVMDWIEKEDSLLPHEAFRDKKLTTEGYAFNEQNKGPLQLIFPSSVRTFKKQQCCSIMVQRELTFTKNQKQEKFTLAERYDLYIDSKTQAVTKIKRACTKI